MFIITMINIEIRIEFCMSALLNTTGIKKATATKEKMAILIILKIPEKINPI